MVHITFETISTKNTKRAERRSARERMVAKAKRVANLWKLGSWRGDNGINEFAAKHADNLKSCSCWMCQNERRLNGPTRQELRDPSNYGEE